MLKCLLKLQSQDREVVKLGCLKHQNFDSLSDKCLKRDDTFGETHANNETYDLNLVLLLILWQKCYVLYL